MKIITKFLILSGMAAIASLFSNQPIQAVNTTNIIGRDDRITPAYEWLTRPNQARTAFGQLIIQLPNGNWAACSGTMVAPDLVLTNSHCVQDATGNIIRQGRFFATQYGDYPNTYNPRYFLAANVTGVWRGRVGHPTVLGDFAKGPILETTDKPPAVWNSDPTLSPPPQPQIMPN